MPNRISHLLALLTVVFTLVVTAAAQTKPECPLIEVTGPVGIVRPGELAAYGVTVQFASDPIRPAYKWTVSAGEIVSGQGTASIEVRQPDSSLTITVEVFGLPKGCAYTESETSSGPHPPPLAVKIGEMSNTAPLDLKLITRFGDALADNPSNQGYVYIAYKPITPPDQIAERERALVEAFSRERIGHDMRITLVRMTSSREVTEFWRVPPGADNPMCDACEHPANACPSIGIEHRGGVVERGDHVEFRVKNRERVSGLSFHWTVKNGKIAGGQGTSGIRVLPATYFTRPVEAAVKVRGLPEGCADTFEESYAVPCHPYLATSVDVSFWSEYKAVPWTQERKQLAGIFARGLRWQPEKIVYIEKGFPLNSTARTRDAAINRIRSYVLRTLKIPRNKLYIRSRIGPLRNPALSCPRRLSRARSEMEGVLCAGMKMSASRLLLPILIALAAMVASAQTECPTITVTGPAGIPDEGALIPFYVQLQGNFPAGISYRWSVSTGKIVEGQGTDKGRFDVGWPTGATVIATVEVIGLPQGCPNTASDKLAVSIDPGPIYVGSSSEPRAYTGRVKELIAELEKYPNSQGYIFIGTKSSDRYGQIGRLIRATASENGLDQDRLTIRSETTSRELIDLWVIRPGVDDPLCNACESIPQHACPTITVTGPAAPIWIGDTTIFTINADLDLKGLKFQWTVSAGTITLGEGTPSIEVQSDPGSDSPIIATVEVSGLPEGCQKFASETVGIKEPGHPVMFDEYGSDLSAKDELERLDLVATEWKNHPSHYFYFIVYRGPKESLASERARIKRIKDRLTVNRKMPVENVVIVIGGVGLRRSTHVYKVPADSDWKPTP